MAIRMQKGRQRPFFVYWTNPFTGRRESKSCATKEEAQKLDAFVKYQLRHEREAFRRETVSAPEPQVQTFESALYFYLKDRKLALENLRKLLSATAGLLDEYGATPLAQVDGVRLQRMQDGMAAAGNKAATIRRKLGIVRAVLRWAQRARMIDALPVFPALPKVQHARYVPPSPEEVAALFQAAPDHLRRVIVLGYYAGMRVGVSELLRLTWQEVDMDARLIRVPNANKGSAEPWREVPIQRHLAPLLRQWQTADAACGMAYVVHYRGQPVRKIKTAWAATLRRAGITRHIRPYDLRHGFATQIIAGGADVGTVAALMGHTSPVMVLKHYQHVLNTQKRAAIDSLPPVPECVQIDVCKQ